MGNMLAVMLDFIIRCGPSPSSHEYQQDLTLAGAFRGQMRSDDQIIGGWSHVIVRLVSGWATSTGLLKQWRLLPPRDWGRMDLVFGG